MRTFSLLAVALLAPLVPAQDRPPLAPADAKKAFLKLLDRPRVPPDPKLDGPAATANGLTYQAWSFASEAKADGTTERVPVLTVRPEKVPGNMPAVIVLHGTGGTKEGVASWLEEFARKGVVGVAIDARYHGARSGGAKGSAAYVAAITKAWQTPAGRPHEHPIYYDTVWDLWRLVDVIRAGPAVDADRVGMLGISMGGIQTWLAASVDDRVAVAAPLIGVQSFRWSLDNDRWQGRARSVQAAHDAAARDLGEPAVNRRVCRELWGKVIPGVTTDFDCPNLIRLFAPRPLFVANGADDPNCPVEGARLAVAAARDEYAKAGAADRFDARIADGVAHQVTAEHRAAAIAFCVKWLTR
ncbi:alpha/beta hydrolase [Urbifossiella limnaea]|uniref:Esterase n=1 Tax=Urbifossiella limnaea TaxID=2528023 RepID=A0A517XQC1_9BACT|nr:alpha/beta hydrolase [Urbifossiella limnaea]QDU19703.1 esterase [Urbifossiella limnaea]